jgi:sugar transport protein
VFQIFPTSFRARGLNFAASGGSIGSIVVAQVWPVGIANIGSKTYFIFMAINLACIPVVYLFFPETKHRTLEDMEVLFNKNSSESTSSLHDPGSIDNKSQVEHDSREV